MKQKPVVSRPRWAARFFLVGCAAAGVSLVMFHLVLGPNRPPGVLRYLIDLVTYHDPLGLWLATRASDSICHESAGLAGRACYAVMFEGWLVAAFGLECAVIGLVAATVVRRHRSDAVLPRRRILAVIGVLLLAGPITVSNVYRLRTRGHLGLGLHSDVMSYVDNWGHSLLLAVGPEPDAVSAAGPSVRPPA